MKLVLVLMQACVPVAGEIPVSQLPCTLNGNVVSYDPVLKVQRIEVTEYSNGHQPTTMLHVQRKETSHGQ